MRKHMSPAMIIALIALFFALSGGAFAAAAKLITGSQIASETITGTNVKDGSLEATELSSAAQASLSSTGLVYVDGAGQLVNQGASADVSALCPTGKQVVSGWLTIDRFNPDGSLNGPQDNSQTFLQLARISNGRQSYVTVVKNSQSYDVQATAHAVCITP